MYLARNSNGCLWLHQLKPRRVKVGNKGYWISNGAKMIITSRATHPRWEDEPIPVQLQSDWINESAKLNY